MKKIFKDKLKYIIPAALLLIGVIAAVVIISHKVGGTYYSDNNRPGSKKGIQLNHSFIGDAKDLDVDWGFVNFSTKLMSAEPTEYSIEYKGRVYYFDEEEIETYDNLISDLTDDGVNIIASVLNHGNDAFPELIYPDVVAGDATMYYAFNVETKEGIDTTTAFAEFFVERYTNGEHGHICDWLVGNEVNDNLQYHYMNPCDMQTYVKAYYEEFKLFYDIIKKHDKEAVVYIPLEHRWQTANTMTDYGGRWFLEYFHELELAENRDMDWGVAWHPYPYPLGDPDTLDDGDYPTIDTDETPSYGGEVTLDYTTPIISMKNIDILTDYLKENLLTKKGKVRPVILSEVGYTSFSVVVGENEAKQAANLAYAYYKAESNPYIKALIIRSHCDEFEGSPYFQFGLRHGIENPTKKMSYDVYKTLGTDEGMKYDRMLLSVLGADDWNEIIPGCKRSVKDISGDTGYFGEGKDISQCSVVSPGTQQYTGRPILPGIEVYDGDKLLEEKTDYYTSYTSNAEPGTARVSIVGTGDYSGYTESYFDIKGDYAAVLDPAWYFAHNEAAREACGGDLTKAEAYFIEHDMSAGVQGSEEFNVKYYLNNYPDLSEAFGDNYKAAYEHYAANGKSEGRVADRMLDTAVYQGFDYTYVYDVSYAALQNYDIWLECGEDPYNMLEYFVTKGMAEGMRASDRFDWELYRDMNGDIAEAFGDDIKEYYRHYCANGFAEGRPACGMSPANDTEKVYKGYDYRDVFDADYYMSHYEDAKKYAQEHSSTRSKKATALEHFVIWGMKEGRKGNDLFDPEMYKALYSDVREAYGDCYAFYYNHYILWGKPEGRFTSVKVL